MDRPIAMAVGLLCAAVVANACSDSSPSSGIGQPIGCQAAVECLAPCADQACVNNCRAKISTNSGPGLFDAYLACGNAACPSTAGGPCATPTAPACQTCWGTTVAASCTGQKTACQQDG
jgi:hypothetical protein